MTCNYCKKLIKFRHHAGHMQLNTWLNTCLKEKKGFSWKIVALKMGSLCIGNLFHFIIRLQNKRSFSIIIQIGMNQWQNFISSAYHSFDLHSNKQQTRWNPRMSQFICNISNPKMINELKYLILTFFEKRLSSTLCSFIF